MECTQVNHSHLSLYASKPLTPLTRTQLHSPLRTPPHTRRHTPTHSASHPRTPNFIPTESPKKANFYSHMAAETSMDWIGCTRNDVFRGMDVLTYACAVAYPLGLGPCLGSYTSFPSSHRATLRLRGSRAATRAGMEGSGPAVLTSSVSVSSALAAAAMASAWTTPNAPVGNACTWCGVGTKVRLVGYSAHQAVCQSGVSHERNNSRKRMAGN
jgi:hypothetical protein